MCDFYCKAEWSWWLEKQKKRRLFNICSSKKNSLEDSKNLLMANTLCFAISTTTALRELQFWCDEYKLKSKWYTNHTTIFIFQVESVDQRSIFKTRFIMDINLLLSHPKGDNVDPFFHKLEATVSAGLVLVPVHGRFNLPTCQEIVCFFLS